MLESEFNEYVYDWEDILSDDEPESLETDDFIEESQEEIKMWELQPTDEYMSLRGDYRNLNLRKVLAPLPINPSLRGKGSYYAPTTLMFKYGKLIRIEHTLDEFATKIQSMFRATKIRHSFNKVKQAKKIQTFYRCSSQRRKFIKLLIKIEKDKKRRERRKNAITKKEE